MLTRTRTHAGHTERVIVRPSPVGWEVREEQDSAVVRTIHYSDWHRVERAVLAFEMETRDRTDEGASRNA